MEETPIPSSKPVKKMEVKAPVPTPKVERNKPVVLWKTLNERQGWHDQHGRYYGNSRSEPDIQTMLKDEEKKAAQRKVNGLARAKILENEARRLRTLK